MALDVYGLTRRRDKTTIDRFLDEYVDRAASEDRGDEELRLEPLDTTADDEDEQLESEPAHSLSHIIERGLSYPRRAFTAYFTSPMTLQREGIERAIVAFTRDDQLVLRLSIYDGDYDADDAQAKAILSHLAQVYGCQLGLILIETPPPLSEMEFRTPSSDLWVAYHATFNE